MAYKWGGNGTHKLMSIDTNKPLFNLYSTFSSGLVQPSRRSQRQSRPCVHFRGRVCPVELVPCCSRIARPKQYVGKNDCASSLQRGSHGASSPGSTATRGRFRGRGHGGGVQTSPARGKVSLHWHGAIGLSQRSDNSRHTPASRASGPWPRPLPSRPLAASALPMHALPMAWNGHQTRMKSQSTCQLYICCSINAYMFYPLEVKTECISSAQTY